MSDESTRMHVVFQGHVQGVGFRHSTLLIAKTHPVTGWVKNLSNGDVELVAEGSSAACSELLSAIRERMFEYITDIDCSWEPATHQFENFEIRY